MAREIFVDTGAWIGLFDRRDTFHAEADAIYRTELRRWPTWVTINLVVAETHALIRYRGGYDLALRFLARLRTSTRLVLIYSDAALEAQAEAILRQYADQDFSLTDAVSFAVMRARGMSDAFAFDRHFLTAGFTPVPAPAGKHPFRRATKDTTVQWEASTTQNPRIPVDRRCDKPYAINATCSTVRPAFRRFPVNA